MSRVSRRRVGIVALSAMILTCGGLMVMTGLLSTQGSPLARFDGWVQVVVPQEVALSGGANRMQLSAEIAEGGPRGRMTYSITVCGERPVEGWILVGGDARIESNRPIQPDEFVSFPMSGGSIDGSRDYGPVQAFRFDFAGVPPCADGSRVGSGDQIFGIANSFTGVIARPTAATRNLGPLHAATVYVSMPLVGGFPGLSPNESGIYRAEQLGENELLVPPALESRAVGGALGLDASVEEARPPVATSGALTWGSKVGIQPEARLGVPGRAANLSLLQNAAGVLLGVAAGLFGAVWYAAGKLKRPRFSAGPIRGAALG